MAETTEKTLPTDGDLARGLTERRISPLRWEAAVHAFGELYNRHAERLLLFLFARLPREEVEDAHRAVWRNVWQNDRRPGEGVRFAAVLQGIALGEIASRRKNRKDSAQKNSTALKFLSRSDAGDAVVERAHMDRLRESLQELDSQVGRVVRRRLSGESYETICAELHIDAAQARQLFERGKAVLSHDFQRDFARPS